MTPHGFGWMLVAQLDGWKHQPDDGGFIILPAVTPIDRLPVCPIKMRWLPATRETVRRLAEGVSWARTAHSRQQVDGSPPTSDQPRIRPSEPHPRMHGRRTVVPACQPAGRNRR